MMACENSAPSRPPCAPLLPVLLLSVSSSLSSPSRASRFACLLFRSAGIHVLAKILSLSLSLSFPLSYVPEQDAFVSIASSGVANMPLVAISDKGELRTGRKLNAHTHTHTHTQCPQAKPENACRPLSAHPNQASKCSLRATSPASAPWALSSATPPHLPFTFRQVCVCVCVCACD
jgi:hypothetical protein